MGNGQPIETNVGVGADQKSMHTNSIPNPGKMYSVDQQLFPLNASHNLCHGVCLKEILVRLYLALFVEISATETLIFIFIH